jgi:hypothetical protein
MVGDHAIGMEEMAVNDGGRVSWQYYTIKWLMEMVAAASVTTSWGRKVVDNDGVEMVMIVLVMMMTVTAVVMVMIMVE